MSSGERPIGAAKGPQSDTEALCQPPPPPLIQSGACMSGSVDHRVILMLEEVPASLYPLPLPPCPHTGLSKHGVPVFPHFLGFFGEPSVLRGQTRWRMWFVALVRAAGRGRVGVTVLV